MTQPLALTRSPSAPPLAASARGLVRFVCTSNPFYVLSALLVCLGLWMSFGAQVVASQTWALMAGMAGYTLLLAVTACLLVRFVGVWDDVRTVLLLVVLMFLSTSVTFDEVLARSPVRGMACYLAGLAFAAAVSEGMLRGMRLALPGYLRAAYHLALALFFLYPAALTPLLPTPRSEALGWALFGFSAAAGLVALSLLPAVRRGRDYVRDNGSPWRWPLYPWTLFGLLGAAVPARSYLLCWSMQHLDFNERDLHIFGPYFLAPFLLALAVLLLEIGLVERHRGVLGAALALPALMAALTLTGDRPDPIYQWFLGRFVARLGASPLYLALLASSGFFVYAASRRVRGATELLSASLLALAVVGPGTMGRGDWVSARPWPILAVAALQLGLGLRRRDAWRCLFGAFGLALAATIALPSAFGAPSLRGPIAFHLALIALLIVGAGFGDTLGRLLRSAGAVMALLAGLVAIAGPAERFETLSPWVPLTYPLAMAALIAAYGCALGHRPSLLSAGALLSLWLAAAGWRGYGALRGVVVGLDYIALGLVCFGLAALTSVAKAGLLAGAAGARGGKVPSSSG